MNMHRYCMAVLLLALAVCPPARSADKTYPKFNFGVTGIWVTIPESCDRAAVVEVWDGTPAAGKIQIGDVIRAVNGTALQGAIGEFATGPDPRRILGEALGDAEARDGNLVLQVERDGETTDVTLLLPVLGSYSAHWPQQCPKSQKIIASTIARLKEVQREDGRFDFPNANDNAGDLVGGSFAALFLLSTDRPDCIAMAGRYVEYLSQLFKTEGVPASHWCKGAMGLALAEYYLKTGDKRALPAMVSIGEAAVKTQAIGGWGHGGAPAPQYSHGGIMSLPSAMILSSLILARECGVDSGESALQRALPYYSRFPGHDSGSYGDQRGNSGGSSNGKTAAFAVAFSLLESQGYRRMSNLLALESAQDYYATQTGHGGCSFNMLWRGIGGMHLHPEQMTFHRRQMDELAWLYDLSRLPGGGFNMLPPSTRGYGSPNLSGEYWGIGLALAYTAPRRNLRITGGKPTQHSQRRTYPEPAWEGAKTSDFLRTDYCKGGEVNTLSPAEIHAQLFYFLSGPKGKPSVQTCAVMMRHYLPHVRNWASNNLCVIGTPEALDEIETALQHSDARVRRAGFNAISNYLGSWFTVDRRRNKVPVEVVARRYMPYIRKTLDSPRSDWWEVDGAVFALSRAGADNVRSYLPMLKELTQHKEMWLRQAAFYCLVHGLDKEMDAQTLLFLAERYAEEGRPFLRNQMSWDIRQLTRDNRTGNGVRFDEDTQKQLAEILSRPMRNTRWSYGYVENGGISRRDPFHVLELVKNFHPDDLLLFSGAMIATVDSWEEQDFFDRRQIRFCEQLAALAQQVGEAGRPLMERLAKVYTGKPKMRRGLEKLGEAIRAYEEAFGALENSTDTPKEKTDPDTRGLRKGLIGYWQFDEGDGTTSADSSAMNNKATLKGGAEWEAGLIGRAVKLGKGQSVVVPGYKDPVTAGRIRNLSVSFWIKTNEYGSGRIGKGRHGTFRKIVTNWFYSYDAVGAGWDVRLPDNCLFPFVTAAFDNGQHGLTPKANKEQGIPGYMFQAVDDGTTWHHVAFSYDGERKAFRGWVDGNRSDTTSDWNSTSTQGLSEAGHIIPATDAILTIGGMFEKDGQVESFDEVAIWGRMLSDDEVRQLYNNGLGSTIDNP